MLTPNSVYLEYYPFQNPSGTMTSNWSFNSLSFNSDDTPNSCMILTENYDEKIFFVLESSFTGTVNFQIDYDDGVEVTIDDIIRFSSLTGNGIFSDNFNVALSQGKYYSSYILYRQILGGYKLILSWSDEISSMIQISMSNIYVSTLIAASPYNINIVDSIWGDGRNTGIENWDDDNKSNGDGWNSSCTVETGWAWSGGSSTTKDIWYEICGDGIRFNTKSTYWDDYNLYDADGWSSTWNVETGWTCSGGNSSTKDIWYEVWGDGMRFNYFSTSCDDGNSLSNDGCSSSWSIETGWRWSGGNSKTKDTWTEIWGDGKRFNSVSTYWDDGNLSDNDGWSTSCSIETGWTCSGGNSSTKDIWSEIWGDGKRFNSVNIYCDDGNKLNGDGCSSGCLKEIGWECSGGNSSNNDKCSEICGDGKKLNSVNTYWDDGNTSSNDGWSSSWSIEAGWIWSGGSSSSRDIWIEVWGDSKKLSTASTDWDDGNTSNGDGWNSSCSEERGWKWTGGSSSKSQKPFLLNFK